MKDVIKKMIRGVLGKFGIFVMGIPSSGICAEDCMATLHNTGCLNTPEFKRAYARGKAIRPDYNIQWRAYVACWAASQAKRAGKGNFVECGVNYGFISSVIMTYLDWNTLGRKYYLIDTYQGMCEQIVSDPEKAAGYIEHSRKALAQGEYVSDVERVKKNFSEWPSACVVQGFVPDVLKEIPASPIAFVHIDMNNVIPEKAAAEHFWPLLIKGGVMLLDDYAYLGFDLSKKGMDEFARSVGVEILSLPTGQGLIIKS